MLFPDYRPRRLRQSDAFRRMVRETTLAVDDLILPLSVSYAGTSAAITFPPLPERPFRRGRP